MTNTTDRDFDAVDFHLAALALEHFLESELKRWNTLDRLHADRAYFQTHLARSLHRVGQLNNVSLQKIYDEVDAMLDEYDSRPSILCRREIIDLLRDIIRRFFCMARGSRPQKEDES